MCPVVYREVEDGIWGNDGLTNLNAPVCSARRYDRSNAMKLLVDTARKLANGNLLIWSLSEVYLPRGTNEEVALA